MAEPVEGAGSRNKALSRGLNILRILVEATGPLSATDIARRCGLHQSSASRILATLAEEGYVRKDSYHSFVPDYGVLALGVAGQSRFELIEKPRYAIADAAQRCRGLSVTLSMLWRGQMLYFLRSTGSNRPVLFEGDGYPMHLSSPALLFVSAMPDTEALALLRLSRRRFGWERPTAKVPASERAVLTLARRLAKHECLILSNWTEPNHVSASINLLRHDGHPLAIAITGDRDVASDDELRLLLHEVRHDVEQQLGSAVQAS